MNPRADIVLVFGGTNDYGHGNAPIGSINDSSPYTFCGAMNMLCNSLSLLYKNAVVIFITPLHRLGEENPYGENKPFPSGSLRRYVDAICDIAGKYSFMVLDLYHGDGPFGTSNTDYKTLLIDGLHPNDNGHEVLCEEIIKFIKAI